MKNILGALAVVALGSLGLAASANASPASSLAGLDQQAAPAMQQVTWYGGRKFYGKYYYKPHYRYYRYKPYYGYGYRHYGYGNWWKNYCHYHPYHWKCKHYGYGY